MDELIEMLESTANLMRGMCFDPSIPKHAKEALESRYKEIDKLVEDAIDNIESDKRLATQKRISVNLDDL